MLRYSILLSVRHEFSRRARLLVALLALLQFIAPTWHVCEMGASSCCPPPSGRSELLHCPQPATQSARAALCQYCPQDGSQPQFTVSATPGPHAENCLAKLLLGMPWQGVAPLELFKPATSHQPLLLATPRRISIATLPQPPSRGPPVFSL